MDKSPESSAERKELTATPHKSSVVSPPRPRPAMPITSKTASAPPAKAHRETAEKPQNDTCRLSSMAAAAPSAAPEETPKSPGSAMGLRNTPCISVPETASAAPTT